MSKKKYETGTTVTLELTFNKKVTTEEFNELMDTLAEKIDGRGDYIDFISSWLDNDGLAGSISLFAANDIDNVIALNIINDTFSEYRA
jgi:hypothetical protein